MHHRRVGATASDNCGCCCIRQQYTLMHQTMMSSATADNSGCHCIRQQWMLLYEVTMDAATHNTGAALADKSCAVASNRAHFEIIHVLSFWQ